MINAIHGIVNYQVPSEIPTVPTDLAATVVSDSEIDWTWSAATDDVGVTGYEISLDGGAAIDVGNVLGWPITSLSESTLYGLRVRSYDAAGNRSAWSDEVSATTDEGPAVSLVSSESAGGTGGGALTTPGLDTTGADLVVVALTYINSFTPTLSDSKGNIWTALPDYLGQGTYAALKVQLYYCLDPSVGPGHTFTMSAGTHYGSIAAAAFSYGSGGFDAESGAGSTTSGAATIQPGSITPSTDRSLVVTATGYCGNQTSSIDDSFIKIEDADGVTGGGFSVALAYKVQAAAASENPTWSSHVAAERMAAAMAVFKRG